MDKFDAYLSNIDKFNIETSKPNKFITQMSKFPIFDI